MKVLFKINMTAVNHQAISELKNNILPISVQKREIELKVGPSSKRRSPSPYIGREKLLAVAY